MDQSLKLEEDRNIAQTKFMHNMIDNAFADSEEWT